MMQSASYGFLLIFTYLHQALLGLAEFTALFQNFRVFIPVIRELFLSNASSDAGRHPRFPGYPLAFLPSCESVHSLGKKARNQLCITAALVRQFFHIQRNHLAFLFIFLNFFHFRDMKPLYLPDIDVWTGERGEEGFLPVFQTPEHSPVP